MDLCKIGTTIYIIVQYLQDPSTKIRYIEVKDINGNKQKFGSDFTYASPGLVTFTGLDFNLASGDKVEFVIY